jgi:hypothetical protein
MQRIDKATIYELFGTHILRAICCTERTEEKDSSDKASRIASFSSSRPSSLGDDETSSEFRANRPKIASLQNLVTLEYEAAFSWSTATRSWRVACFESPLGHRKRTTLLCFILSIATI